MSATVQNKTVKADDKHSVDAELAAEFDGMWFASEFEEGDVQRADSLLWVDQAEVYALCSDCYFDNRDGQWTGSTQNPNYHELQQTMNERLQDGCACAFCKSDRIDELKEEIEDEVEVQVVVVK